MKKPVNKLPITYLIDNCGVAAGTKKTLKEDIAIELEKRGIVSIDGKVKVKDEAPAVTKDQPAAKNKNSKASKK